MTFMQDRIHSLTDVDLPPQPGSAGTVASVYPAVLIGSHVPDSDSVVDAGRRAESQAGMVET